MIGHLWPPSPETGGSRRNRLCLAKIESALFTQHFGERSASFMVWANNQERELGSKLPRDTPWAHHSTHLIKAGVGCAYAARS